MFLDTEYNESATVKIFNRREREMEEKSEKQPVEKKITTTNKKGILKAKSPKDANDANVSKIVRCQFCNKMFSKVANLNDHIAVKHKGRRFICTICQEEQTTKASHIRHMERRHPDQPVENVREKEFYATNKIEMTEAAKNALLERFSKELVNKNKIISKQKKIIAELRDELDQLKQKQQSNTQE